MEALIYAPTAHALMWRMAESHRSMIADILRAAQPLRAFTIYARVSIDPDFGALSIVRLNADQPLPFFDALERPLPLIARPREFWYPHLTGLIRPERHPRQARPDTLVVWGPPRAPLSSIRVPTPTVSMIDFVVELERTVSVGEVNETFREAAQSKELEGILEVTDEELVSSDFIGSTASAIVDLPLTMALGGNLIKVIAWYDNEWGYATRVADLTAFIADEMEV